MEMTKQMGRQTREGATIVTLVTETAIAIASKVNGRDYGNGDREWK